MSSELDDILELINYYHKELKYSTVAKDYLKSRGIIKESIIRFKIGYCPHNPTKGHIKYQDRIIFPYWNTQDEIVGWIGRTLVDGPKKYLNTPESAIFKKSKLLYGYNFAKKAIFKTKTAVLVEGQMDIILLQQAGIFNTVAASTAGIKETGANLLSRFAKRVYIAFDGDEAGYKGAIASQLELVKSGMPDVIIVKMPDKEDPASFIQQYGKDGFLRLLYEHRQVKTLT